MRSSKTTIERMQWPELPYEAWRETKETLHMYLQIVGKVRAALAPTEPDWGHAPFSLTARGLTTSPIPHPNGVFDIDVDLIDHALSVRATDGRVERIRLEPRTVAEFHSELLGLLDTAGFTVEISAGPGDVRDGIPFAEDVVHGSYEPEWANRFWQVHVCVDRVLKEHRARFRGKTSPVQLWWGSFDLAYSRLRYASRRTASTPYVYTWCMSKVRTNIEIEDTYLEAIMDRYGVHTKTEAVDLALRHLAGQPMTREEALAMRGAHAIGEIPDDTAPTPL